MANPKIVTNDDLRASIEYVVGELIDMGVEVDTLEARRVALWREARHLQSSLATYIKDQSHG